MKTLKSKTSLLLFSLLSSVPLAQNASAGVSGLGNGGDVRVCFKSTDTYETVLERISANRDGVNTDVFAGIDISRLDVRLFDFVAAERRGIFGKPESTLVELDGDVFEILNNRINVFKDKTNFDEILTQVIEGPLANDKWTPSSTGVVEIDDSNHGVNLPSNCMLIQIAVQNDVGVVYDERLYARLNDLEKAGLILHEMAFFLGRIHDKTITALNDRDRRSTALDHADSTRIREFTVRVFSQDIEELSSLEMFEWLVDDVRLAVNGIALSSYSFVDILGEQRSVLDAWATVEQRVVRDFDAKHDFLSLRYAEVLGAAKIVNPGAEVLIDSEGNLLGIKQKFIYENLTFTSGNFFEGNGRLASGNLERSTVIQSVPVGGGEVFFHGNGRLYRGSLSQEHTFAKRRGTKTLRNGDQFWLDEEGYLTNR